MMRRCISVLAITALAWLTLVTGPPDSPASEAAFPGYNGKIAYTSVSSDDSDIWIIEPDGTHPQRLTNEPPALKLDPAWSPGGTQLAFTDLLGRDLFVYDLNTDEASNLTPDIEEFVMFPAWSPDGDMLALTLLSTVRGTIDLYTIHADGTELSRLTNIDNSDEDMPAWSPDGQKIAFHSRDGIWYDISVMNPDGSGRMNLTHDAAYDSSPAWSPDGQRIAFASDRARGNQWTDIFTMKADGTDLRRVTETPFPAGSPEWSPDGRFLLYAAHRYSTDIYRVPASGGAPIRLTASPANDTDPTWQSASSPPAKEEPGSLAANPSSGVVGTVVTIRSEDCGESGDQLTVNFEMTGQTPGRATAGDAVVDSSGRFELPYVIPDQMDALMFGKQTVDPGRYVFVTDRLACEAEFTVEADSEWTDPTRGPVPNQDPPGTLPRGGGPPDARSDRTLFAVAVGTLALSLALWAAALRRRSES